MEKVNFNTEEASNYLKSIGLSFQSGTLHVWRCLNKGPRFKKVARKIFYEKAALDEFARGQAVETIDSIYHRDRGQK